MADNITVLPDDVTGLLDPSGLETFFTSDAELIGGLLPGFLIEFAMDDEDISTVVGSNGLTRSGGRSDWKEELIRCR